MAAAIMHAIEEICASFHWLVPVSVFVTAVIGHVELHFHSPSHSPKRCSSVETASKSKFRTPRWPAKGSKQEMTMPGGSEKLDFISTPKVATKRATALIQAKPPRRSLPEPLSSVFMQLPVEVRLLIFRYCAPIPFERQGPNSLDTFLTLLRVSHTIQQEALKACLPHIPLALWSKKGVLSFRDLLKKKPGLGCFVRYLWIGTGKLDDEEVAWALDVIKGLTQLRSIACGEYILAQAVNGQMLAKTCETITLMGLDKGVEYKAWGVKRVRLCTGVYSTKERFPNVSMLCFNARRINIKDERVRMEYEIVDRWAANVERIVLVERDLKRASARGLDLKFKVPRRGERPEMFSVTLPARWTEWDIWSSDVVGAGVWDVCGLM